MKVILLRDVARVGKRYDIAEVADGFALNRLIPQGDAEPATPKNVERVERMRSKVSKDSAAEHEAFVAAVSTIKKEPLVVLREINEQGNLFKAVKPADVALALKERTGFSIEDRAVSMEAPIKSVGEHEILLIHGDAKETVTVVVQPAS